MRHKNAGNERIKRDYFHYLRNADRKSEQTIKQAAKAISRYEDFNERQDFKTFNQKMAVDFKTELAETGVNGGAILGHLRVLEQFFGHRVPLPYQRSPEWRHLRMAKVPMTPVE